jgi:hypothetical protein
MPDQVMWNIPGKPIRLTNRLLKCLDSMMIARWMRKVF